MEKFSKTIRKPQDTPYRKNKQVKAFKLSKADAGEIFDDFLKTRTCDNCPPHKLKPSKRPLVKTLAQILAKG